MDILTQVVPVNILAGHYHNTYGMALANVMVSLDAGIRIFDSSIGGLGGCPFAPGAAGNVPTEDLVFMLNRMGMNTGINYDQVKNVVQYVRGLVPPKL